MRILGLDPGLRHTGWGVIETDGNRLSFVAAGAISPVPALSLSERLRCLHDGLFGVLEQFRPAEAAIEETFVNRNAEITLTLC